MVVKLSEPTSDSPLRREVGLYEAGLGGPLVLHGTADRDYSYRSVARLSKRGQDATWPATAQKF